MRSNQLCTDSALMPIRRSRAHLLGPIMARIVRRHRRAGIGSAPEIGP
jgi:hypothetical protein